VKREFETMTLPDQDSEFLATYVCDELMGTPDPIFINLAKVCARNAHTDSLRELILGRIRLLFDRQNWLLLKGAAVILKNLFKGGLRPTQAHIDTLKAKPVILSGVLKRLILAIEVSEPPDRADQIIRELLSGIKFECRHIKSLLAVSRLPEFAIAYLKHQLTIDPIARPVMFSFLNRWERIVELGLSTPAELLMMSCRARIAQSKAPPELLRFLIGLNSSDFTLISQDVLSSFIRDFCTYSCDDAFEFCMHTIQKAPIIEPEVCCFLLDSKVVSNLKAWCAAFSRVVPFVSPERRASLFAYLHTLTLNELRFGHVVLENGLKEIQTRPISTAQKSTANPRTDISPSPARCVKSHPSFHPSPMFSFRTSAFVGWRELSALLLQAPPNFDTLSLMTAALDAHPHALAPTFVVVLSRFDDVSANQWIASLLEGSQKRQLLALDLLTSLGNRTRPLLEQAVVRYVRDRSAPALLRCRAIRIVAGARERNPDAFRELDADLSHLREPAEVDALGGVAEVPPEAPRVRFGPIAGDTLPPLFPEKGEREVARYATRAVLRFGRKATSVLGVRNRR
jgi:hypothetical protein